ncbi:hypothetical protein IG631_23605 [Alternaria alternata]|nr:hypothetical protein IG631_23605 [Alternaria alternata]
MACVAQANPQTAKSNTVLVSLSRSVREFCDVFHAVLDVRWLRCSIRVGSLRCIRDNSRAKVCRAGVRSNPSQTQARNLRCRPRDGS